MNDNNNNNNTVDFQRLNTILQQNDLESLQNEITLNTTPFQLSTNETILTYSFKFKPQVSASIITYLINHANNQTQKSDQQRMIDCIVQYITNYPTSSETIETILLISTSQNHICGDESLELQLDSIIEQLPPSIVKDIITNEVIITTQCIQLESRFVAYKLNNHYSQSTTQSIVNYLQELISTLSIDWLDLSMFQLLLRMTFYDEELFTYLIQQFQQTGDEFVNEDLLWQILRTYVTFHMLPQYSESTILQLCELLLQLGYALFPTSGTTSLIQIYHVNPMDNQVVSTLHNCFGRQRYYSIAQFIIHHGCDPHYILPISVECDRPYVFIFLMRNNIRFNWNYCHYDSNSLLFISCEYAKWKLFHLILENNHNNNNINVDYVNKNDETALQHLIQWKQWQKAQYLIENSNVSIHHPHKYTKMTILHIIAQHNDDERSYFGDESEGDVESSDDEDEDGEDSDPYKYKPNTPIIKCSTDYTKFDFIEFLIGKVCDEINY